MYCFRKAVFFFAKKSQNGRGDYVQDTWLLSCAMSVSRLVWTWFLHAKLSIPLHLYWGLYGRPSPFWHGCSLHCGLRRSHRRFLRVARSFAWLLALRSYLGRLEKKTCLCNLAFVASFLGKADASSASFCILQALFNATKKRKICARPAFIRLTLAHRTGKHAEGFASALATPHRRALLQKTVTGRFTKLLANLHRRQRWTWQRQ